MSVVFTSHPEETESCTPADFDRERVAPISDMGAYLNSLSSSYFHFKNPYAT